MPKNTLQGMTNDELKQSNDAFRRAWFKDPVPQIPPDFSPATFETYEVVAQVTHDHALKQLHEARSEVEDLKAELVDVKAYYEKKLKATVEANQNFLQ